MSDYLNQCQEEQAAANSQDLLSPQLAIPQPAQLSPGGQNQYLEGSTIQELVRPNNLQEAVCMYIDYLIQENHSIVHIMSPGTPPEGSTHWEHEPYLQDVLRKPASFPTRKFRAFMRQFNIEVEVHRMDGGDGEAAVGNMPTSDNSVFESEGSNLDHQWPDENNNNSNNNNIEDVDANQDYNNNADVIINSNNSNLAFQQPFPVQINVATPVTSVQVQVVTPVPEAGLVSANMAQYENSVAQCQERLAQSQERMAQCQESQPLIDSLPSVETLLPQRFTTAKIQHFNPLNQPQNLPSDIQQYGHEASAQHAGDQNIGSSGNSVGLSYAQSSRIRQTSDVAPQSQFVPSQTVHVETSRRQPDIMLDSIQQAMVQSDVATLSEAAQPETAPDYPQVEARTVPDYPQVEARTVPDYRQVEARTVPDYPQVEARTVPDYRQVEARTVLSYPQGGTRTVSSYPQGGTRTVPEYPQGGTRTVSSYPVWEIESELSTDEECESDVSSDDISDETMDMEKQGITNMNKHETAKKELQTYMITSETDKLESEMEKMDSETDKVEVEIEKNELENEIIESTTGMVSETQLSEPEIESMEPETEKMQPETQMMQPDAEKMEPETETVETETEKMEPETEKIQPETEKMQPETEKVQPETEKMEPEIEKMETGKVESHIRKSELTTEKVESQIEKSETTEKVESQIERVNWKLKRCNRISNTN